jgi:hypothetical protein
MIRPGYHSYFTSAEGKDELNGGQRSTDGLSSKSSFPVK